MLETWSTARDLAAALAVGLLIGVERGWRDRELAEGARVAGLRTFGLAGLLGGALAVLTPELGGWPLAAGMLALGLLLAASYPEGRRASGSLSITTSVATLLTFALGALAGRGDAALALAAAVLTAVLLNLKPTLHRWLRLIAARELTAALQLLVLSVVILPNLPDTGYGPYQALNPYRLWWGVVLVAGLSLAGHLAIRLAGARHGVLWTGLLGGLASSTAATLALARHARRQGELAGAAAAGAVAACGVMFFRILVVVAVIDPALARHLGLPLLAAGTALLLAALWQWRSSRGGQAAQIDPVAPYDLATALGFGALLALMAVLAPAAMDWLGTPGIYALASISGLADVDATSISVARMHGAGALATAAAGVAIGLTVLTNMVAKAAIAGATGGAGFGWPLLRGYAFGLAAGALAMAWTLPA